MTDNTNTTNLMPRPSTSGNNTSLNNDTSAKDIICSCNLPAIQLTTKKDGPNKGRQFYKCPNGLQNNGCNFFLWASEVNTTTADNNTITIPTVVQCNCNQAATLRTVSKDGPNKGRQFYSCSKPVGQGCNFFKWADQVI